MSRFKTGRADGRSNADVLIGVVEAAHPGDLLTYESLADTLGEGTGRTWGRAQVQSSVNSALWRIRRATNRTLIPVHGKGYRVPLANEHMSVARRRDRKALIQHKHALETLRHTCCDELSAGERARWEMQLAVNGALFSQVALVTRRQQRQQAAIDALMSRVDRLESIPG